MMKTIIALLLASSASAFKPSKAFLGFAGLASASKYDPKNFEFEDASTAKDAFPFEQGERRLSSSLDRLMLQNQIEMCYRKWMGISMNQYGGYPDYVVEGRCDNIFEEYKAAYGTYEDYSARFGCGNCEWIIKNAKLESMYFCDCLSSCSFVNTTNFFSRQSGCSHRQCFWRKCVSSAAYDG